MAPKGPEELRWTQGRESLKLDQAHCLSVPTAGKSCPPHRQRGCSLQLTTCGDVHLSVQQPWGRLNLCWASFLQWASSVVGAALCAVEHLAGAWQPRFPPVQPPVQSLLPTSLPPFMTIRKAWGHCPVSGHQSHCAIKASVLPLPAARLPPQAEAHNHHIKMPLTARGSPILWAPGHY